MKHLRLLTFSVAFLCLAACQELSDTVDRLSDMGVPAGTEQAKSKSLAERLVEKGGCPEVGVLKDLGSFYDFQDFNDPTQKNLVSRAFLTAPQSSCAFSPKSVTIDMKLSFDGLIGATGRRGDGATSVSYPYFVAIMTPGGQIMTKKSFSAPVDYDAGIDKQTYSVNLREIIPIVNQESGAHYKIVAGFQLNQNQLKYNRAIQNAVEKQKATTTIERNDILRRVSPQVIHNEPKPIEAQPVPAPENGQIILAPQDDQSGLNQ